MEGRRGAGRQKAAAAAAGQVSSSSGGESHLGEAWQAVESEPRSSPGKVNLLCLLSSTRQLLRSSHTLRNTFLRIAHFHA